LESRSHDDLVEDNTITNISGGMGQCIDVDDYGEVGWRHTIRNNRVSNCGNVGIQIENGFDTIIENNTITGGGQAGIIIINYGKGMCKVGGENNQYGDLNGDGDCRGDSTGNLIRQNLLLSASTVGAIVSYDAAGVRVWNNTIYGAHSTGLWLGSGSNTKQWDVRGNIFANNGRAEISAADFSSLVSEDYNDLYQSNQASTYELLSGSGTFTLAQYRSKFGKGTHSTDTNPQFTSPSSSNFRPKVGSPVIDSGINTNLSTDFDGNPRPQGNGFDMGVYEFQLTAPPPNYPNHIFLPQVIS
jgi:parallel beta-helix repeat protein